MGILLVLFDPLSDHLLSFLAKYCVQDVPDPAIPQQLQVQIYPHLPLNGNFDFLDDFNELSDPFILLLEHEV